MSYLDGRVYSEVLAVINTNMFIYEKIPKNIISFLEKHASKFYEVKYPKRDNILSHISKEALELYISLYIDYVATEREREELKKLLIENEMKYRKSLENE